MKYPRPYFFRRNLNRSIFKNTFSSKDENLREKWLHSIIIDLKIRQDHSVKNFLITKKKGSPCYTNNLKTRCNRDCLPKCKDLSFYKTHKFLAIVNKINTTVKQTYPFVERGTSGKQKGIYENRYVCIGRCKKKVLRKSTLEIIRKFFSCIKPIINSNFKFVQKTSMLFLQRILFSLSYCIHLSYLWYFTKPIFILCFIYAYMYKNNLLVTEIIFYICVARNSLCFCSFLALISP